MDPGLRMGQLGLLLMGLSVALFSYWPVFVWGRSGNEGPIVGWVGCCWWGVSHSLNSPWAGLKLTLGRAFPSHVIPLLTSKTLESGSQ